MADTLGTRIMKLRGENETQQQLADALGVSRSLVKAWENDDRPVRSDDLIKLASHYGVSCDYLLGLVGEDNSTDDEKLRMVSDYTGLSNAAITNLIKLYKGCDDDRFSEMLCNDLFMSLLPRIIDIEFAAAWCDDAMRVFEMIVDGAELNNETIRSFYKDAFRVSPNEENNINEECIADDVGEEFCGRYTELRMQLFELNEAWCDFVESFVPTKDLIAKGNKYYRMYH